jgi:polysaccharide biosynthesis protein PslF
MRVLVISAAFPPMRAGEADHAYHLAEHLAIQGFEVHVLTSKGNVEAEANAQIKTHPIMAGWSWRDAATLLRFLKSCSPDSVLLNYIGWIYQYHPMITFAPTFAKMLNPAVRFVTQFENTHGAEPKRFSIATRIARKAVSLWAGCDDSDYSFGTLLRDSDRLIVLSEIHRGRLATRSSRVTGKTVLIPPPPIMKISSEQDGATRRETRKGFGLSEYDFLFAYFGYVYPGKGVETLLDAFQLVLRQHRNARLLILGGFLAKTFADQPNYAQQLVKMPKQLGIEDAVIWFGEYAADSDEASRCLRAADACVLPMDSGIQLNNSSFAGAVAHGLPTITIRGEILESAFVDGHNVLLSPPKSAKPLADAMTRLMEDAQLAARLRAGAHQFARDWFSWETVVQRTAAVVKSHQ